MTPVLYGDEGRLTAETFEPVYANSGAVAPTYDPLTLSPLGWWDASDTASITSSGGAVSQLNDKSGTGKHLTQSAAGSKPITNSQAMNSRNVLVYDGVDDQLISATFTQAQPLTIFVVGKYTSTTPRGIIGNDAASSGGFSPSFKIQSALWFYGSQTAINTGIAADTNPHVWEGVLNGASSAFSLDGTAGVGGNPGAPGYNVGRVIVGTDSALAGDFVGQFCELLIYPSVLSAGNRSAVRSYLGSKWGITVV